MSSPALGGVVFCLVVVSSAVVSAGEDPVRRPPLQELMKTEVVFPQERGELQVTFASAFDQSRDRSAFSLPVTIEYGLTDWWQVSAEWGSFTRVRSGSEAARGSGDASAGSKVAFMHIGGTPVHLATGAELTFHRRLDPLDGRGGEVEPFAAAALDLRPAGLQLFAHGGVSIPFGRDEASEDDEREMFWNVGALLPLRRLTLATEINVEGETLRLRSPEAYLTPSITVRVRKAWEIGAGVPIGLSRQSQTFGVIAHVIYER